MKKQSAKHKMVDAPTISFKACQQKYLLFESRVYCVGTIHALDFDRMVQALVTTGQQANILFDGINRQVWDSFDRYYIVTELLHLRKIKLYDSQEEAEKAL